MIKNRTLLFTMLVLTACMAVSSCGNVNGDTGKVYMHYFTVPTRFSDNSTTTAAVEDLKGYLCETAGGYSGLGTSEGGWMNAQGAVEKEGIVSFMVSSSQNLSEPLKQYLTQHFNQEYPYVVVWEVMAD